MLNSYVKILLFLLIVNSGLSSANPTRIEILPREGEKFQLATFDLWLPPGVEDIRGIIVHQHGCSRPAEKSGLIGAYDLHWQELARQHDFALVVPSFSMTDDCSDWYDPANGSERAFLGRTRRYGKRYQNLQDI